MELLGLSEKVEASALDEIRQVFKSHSIDVSDEETKLILTMTCSAVEIVNARVGVDDKQKRMVAQSIFLRGVVSMMEVLQGWQRQQQNG